MTRNLEVYVDTSSLIAFLDRSDRHHAAFRRGFAPPPELPTAAVAGGHGRLLRRYDGTRARQFLAFIEALDPLAVPTARATEIGNGGAPLRRHCDRALTLADAVGHRRDARVGEC